MIPSGRLAGLLLLVAVAASGIGLVARLGTGPDSRLGLLVLGFDAALLGLTLFDMRGAARRRALEVRREVPGPLVRNQPAVLSLSIAALASEHGSPLAIVDRLPEGCEPREMSWSAKAELGQTLERPVVARRRGRFPLLPPAVVVWGKRGLSWTRGRGSSAPELHVLPDLAALARYDALVRQARLREMGIVRTRLRGEGQEIASLRAYAPGDAFQRIDWKATARRGSPIVREHQAERQQPVVLLLDAGRRMAREANGQSRLDEAIDASLLLAHVALRADDRVGLWAFADVPLRMVAPARGVAHGKRLARAVYDLQPVLRESPYGAMATRVQAAYPRRSLMVLFTDVIEPSSLQQLAGPLRFLGRRHLCLVIIFKDLAVEAALREPPASERALYAAGAAASLAREREGGLAALRQAGALVLEAAPGGLSTAVVNRYLDIKSRQLL